MRRLGRFAIVTILFIAGTLNASAQPAFVNGLVIPGHNLDATREPGANGGRLGFFSDIYYDPWRAEWWALSDRGPGGGLYDYSTRVQRFTLDVHPITGRISRFRVTDTIKLTDPKGLLSMPWAAVARRKALNGLNPLGLNGDAGVLGRSFDPEGLVIDPRTGHLLVADEYGPVVYEFSRKGTLLRVFQTPENLIPKVGDPLLVNYVATRDEDLNAGRQDNRDGAHLILFGNDNDYSVTQTGSGDQLDVYVNFNGEFAKCPLDQQTLCQLNDAGTLTEPVPAGHTLIPGVLHAYKASPSDLAGYRKPEHFFGFRWLRYAGWFGFGWFGGGEFWHHDPFDDCDDH